MEAARPQCQTTTPNPANGRSIGQAVMPTAGDEHGHVSAAGDGDGGGELLSRFSPGQIERGRRWVRIIETSRQEIAFRMWDTSEGRTAAVKWFCRVRCQELGFGKISPATFYRRDLAYRYALDSEKLLSQVDRRGRQPGRRTRTRPQQATQPQDAATTDRPSRKWLQRMSEAEDRCESVAVGGQVKDGYTDAADVRAGGAGQADCTTQTGKAPAPHGRRNASKSNLTGTALDEAVRQLRRLSDDALVALLPVLGELAGLDPPTTAGSVRRAWGRYRLLRRFADLRRQPDNRGQSNRALMLQVLQESPSIAPEVKCSLRSLQVWVQSFNALTEGGLAAGTSALVDNYGRPTGSPRAIPAKRKPTANGKAAAVNNGDAATGKQSPAASTADTERKPGQQAPAAGVVGGGRETNSQEPAAWAAASAAGRERETMSPAGR